MNHNYKFVYNNKQPQAMKKLYAMLSSNWHDLSVYLLLFVAGAVTYRNDHSKLAIGLSHASFKFLLQLANMSSILLVL